MNPEKQLIHLAALIHDIGKFYQRADDDGTRKSQRLSQSVKNLEGTLCPSYDGRYTHKHVLWTAQFVEEISSQLNGSVNPEKRFNPDVLLRTAAAHHNPSSFFEKIIQKADHYSSGADRTKDVSAWKDAVEEEDKKWDSFKRISMRSIFETISPSGTKNENYNYEWKLPVCSISLDKDNFFPTRNEKTIPEYKTLWNQFIAEVKYIQSKSYHTFSETLLFLLEKYTGRIPSSTQHLPDVSLFDHSKTTAAFAACLYDYISEKGGLGNEKMPDVEEQAFVLIGGDISGIQNFIYDIAARGAAKNLKGRSFYLQLLVDNIVRLILDRLELFDTHIIYSSGGGFYILAPNTEKVDKVLKAIEKEVSQKLFVAHGTALSLSLDKISFGENELYFKEGNRSIGDLWIALSEKLGLKKARKFQHVIENGFKELFEASKVNPETKRDYITGDELESNHSYLDKEEKKQPVNTSTQQQIELGKKLKNTDYWILAKQELTYFKEKFHIDPIGIGYCNYFLDEETVKDAESNLKASADNVRVIFFNKGNFLEPLQKGIDNIYGFTWYGGNDFPVNKFDEPKTFTELSGVEFDKPNYKEKEQKRTQSPELVRMGVLRMDVDNLGSIFKKGFPDNKRSFSRYSTLSRSLDYFFKGYLNKLWENNDNYKSFTQIIYSGGDDLFIVGKWDVLASMSKDIQADFKEWTCQNSDVTLSGGMAIVGPKFPILKAAEYSEMYEKKAKKHEWYGREKDAFSLLGYQSVSPEGKTEQVLFSFNWEGEYKYVLGLKNEIQNLFEMDKGLPSGFAGEIYSLMQQANFHFDKKENRFYPKNHRVIWLTAYQFKRAMKDTKNEKVKAFLDNWVINIMTGKFSETDFVTKYHSLQILALAARWAVLEKRSIV